MSSLHALVNAPYPDCPSAGYEWLRFGRLLESDTTATIEAAKPAHSLNPYCLSDDDYGKFKRHHSALAFWEEAKAAGLELDTTHVHLHPGRFIETFRKCGWLSRDEMIQLFPMTEMRESGHAWVSEGVSILPRTIDAYLVDLNKRARKYGITTPQRMAAFYANAMVETQWFGKLHENSTTARYAPWDGRGFLQLTWPDNYIKYWRFIGKTVDQKLADDLHAAAKQADTQHTNVPLTDTVIRVPAEMQSWREQLASTTNPYQAADSAGAYWVWSGAAEDADTAPVDVRASESVHDNATAYYTSQGAGNVAATVNAGHRVTNYSSVNGIVARFQAYTTCQVVLLDATAFPDASGKPQSTPEGYASRHP